MRLRCRAGRWGSQEPTGSGALGAESEALVLGLPDDLLPKRKAGQGGRAARPAAGGAG